MTPQMMMIQVKKSRRPKPRKLQFNKLKENNNKRKLSVLTMTPKKVQKMFKSYPKVNRFNKRKLLQPKLLPRKNQVRKTVMMILQKKILKRSQLPRKHLLLTQGSNPR